MDNMKEAFYVGTWKTKTRKRKYCHIGTWKTKTRKRRCRRTQPSLPQDIIENILCRLTVKELLRLRLVCKQWEATISDPTFVQIHLQHQKNPSSQNLIAWENLNNVSGLHVAKLRNNCIELVSTIKNDSWREYDYTTWCSCDGLYVMCLESHCKRKANEKHVLWNPSSRTYRELNFPHSIEWNCSNALRGMYYNPLMKEYRIVIGDLQRYAVYSCRDNKWSDVKEMNDFVGNNCYDNTVFVNGSIYWLMVDMFGPDEPGDDDDSEEIFQDVVCFDCKDETFKTLPLPDIIKGGDDKVLRLTSLGGQLCLLIWDWKCCRIEIMKKVGRGDEWMESKEESGLFVCGLKMYPEPLCQVGENEILLHSIMNGRPAYMVYDKSKNTLVEILSNYPPTAISKLRHVENLLLL